MKHTPSHTNPPIADVVIAFQPRPLGKMPAAMKPGRIALFHYGDTRSRRFDYESGACWTTWRNADLDQQLEWMLQLRKELIHDWGVSPTHVEDVFRQCPEFLAMRTSRRPRREQRKSARTR